MTQRPGGQGGVPCGGEAPLACCRPETREKEGRTHRTDCSRNPQEARSGRRTCRSFLGRQRKKIRDHLLSPQISRLGPSSCVDRPQQLPLESPGARAHVRPSPSRLLLLDSRLGGLNTAEMYFQRVWRRTSRVMLLAGPPRQGPSSWKASSPRVLT